MVLTGCGSRPPENTEPPRAAISLLGIKPYIGDEIELRDPSPEVTRRILNNESVAGWLAPPEKILRFPVNIRDGAQVSVRIGILPKVPLHIGDLVFRLAFTRSWQNGPVEINTENILFDARPSATDEWQDNWFTVDVPMDRFTPSSGELILIVDGPMAGNEGVEILWGQPALFHPDEERRGNVLLIGVDTLRADGLSIYGGREEVTPNLQMLSAHGTVFSQARSQAPWTIPSFTSILSGMLPSQIYPTIFTFKFPSTAVSAGEILLTLGFTTGMVCGNQQLGNPDSGYERGMEGMWFEHEADPYESVEHAKDFMSRSMNRDWFCFLHIMDPHAPYTPPEEFAREFSDPEYTGPIGLEFLDGVSWQEIDEIPPAADVRRVRDLYNAEIASVDDAMLDLFTFLEERGMLENTLIIFAADHGEEFFEHGQFEHGQSLYDEMIRMPLIVWGDTFPAGTVIEEPVANIDIVPTIYNFINLETPSYYPGIPLQEYVTGNNPDPGRIIFGEGNLRASTHRKYALEWPYKCVLDFYTSETWLYDIQADPLEMADIGAEHPEIVDRLRTEIISENPVMKNMLVLSVAGNNDRHRVFTGIVEIDAGIGQVIHTQQIGADSYRLEDGVLHFEITSDPEDIAHIRGLIILPSNNAEVISITARVDGQIEPGFLHPYGTSSPEPSGSATVNLSEMPWPATLPPDATEKPTALYLIGATGANPEFGDAVVEKPELDQEAIDQLRALGYIN